MLWFPALETLPSWAGAICQEGAGRPGPAVGVRSVPQLHSTVGINCPSAPGLTGGSDQTAVPSILQIPAPGCAVLVCTRQENALGGCWESELSRRCSGPQWERVSGTGSTPPRYLGISGQAGLQFSDLQPRLGADGSLHLLVKSVVRLN